MGLVRPLYADCAIPNVDIENEVFALDSTTISLSLKLFSWAPGKYSRGAVTAHTLLDLRGSIPSFILVTDGKYHDSNVLDVLVPFPGAIYVMDKAYIDFTALYHMHKSGAFFISRAKTSMDYTVIESNFNIDPRSGLRGDKTIRLNGYKSKKLYPGSLRLVEYYDEEKDILLSFLSNNDTVSALEIAKLYRNRWQIETFFQMDKTKPDHQIALGQSENAVNIHIWVAISTYLIVACVKHTLKSKLSIYEIMQILGISVFDKTSLKELLTECQTNQNVKEQRNLFSD